MGEAHRNPKSKLGDLGDPRFSFTEEETGPKKRQDLTEVT